MPAFILDKKDINSLKYGYGLFKRQLSNIILIIEISFERGEHQAPDLLGKLMPFFADIAFLSQGNAGSITPPG
jgi:hypothetical protein